MCILQKVSHQYSCYNPHLKKSGSNISVADITNNTAADITQKHRPHSQIMITKMYYPKSIFVSSQLTPDK